MGAQTSKFPPPSPRPRPQLRRYVLPFEVVVARLNERPVRPRHLAAAREECESAYTWYDYIDSALKQAGGDEPSAPEDRIFNLAPKISLIDGDTLAGHLTWIGPAVEAAPLQAAIDWCIGDRMAQYGLQDETQGWWGLVKPGTVRISMPQLDDFPLQVVGIPEWQARILRPEDPPLVTPELGAAAAPAVTVPAIY